MIQMDDLNDNTFLLPVITKHEYFKSTRVIIERDFNSRTSISLQCI